MTSSGQVITFYSYKGGTGRTMALANAATLLARDESATVLVMDWDLEAPGLHRFFERAVKSNSKPRRGTIDLLEDLANRVAGVDESELTEDATLALVREVAPERYADALGNESISLMRAGWTEGDNYAARVNGFGWDLLYARAPYLFKALATVLAEHYAYILVDSRTGLSDTSGVCTALLPEKLVLVFTPNQQSLDGVLARARSAVQYRRRADDLRPLLVYPVASRIELSEDELRRRWRHGDGSDGHVGYQPAFEALFRDIYDLPECELQPWFDEVQIQHSARYAYGEGIAVVEDGSTTDRLSLAHSYSRFTRAIERAPSPWELERQEDTRVDADAEQEQIAKALLEDELELHRGRWRFGRQRLIVLRSYQALLIVGGVGVGFAVGINRQVWLWAGIAAGLLGAILLEGFATMTGATQWRRHAVLARQLDEESYRFDTRTRQYAEAPNPGKLLAERVDDIVSEAYGEWGERTFFGLAPIPTRPDRRKASRDM